MQHYDRKWLASRCLKLHHSGHDRPLVEQKHNLSRSGCCCCGEEKKEEECPWVFLFLRFAAVEAKLQSTLGKLFSVDFFLPYLTKSDGRESKEHRQKMPTFYYTKARFARFCVAFWSTVVLLLSLSLFVLIWCKSSKQYLGLTVVYQLIVHSSTYVAHKEKVGLNSDIVFEVVVTNKYIVTFLKRAKLIY